MNTDLGRPETPPAQAGTAVGIHSEHGRLLEVVVHRPGTELDRLTPSNAADLLFDDVMWPERAREEHDAFVDLLTARGVLVHRFGDLLTEAVTTTAGREHAVAQVCTPQRYGPALASRLSQHLTECAPADLSDYLIGGMLTSDLAPLAVSSLTWSAAAIDDLVLAPLPNTLFQRDNAAWIGHGVTINPMAKPARRRESVNTRTVLQHHPRFAAAAFRTYLGHDGTDLFPATLEGGDVHVLADGVVMVGMGERTTPAAVELLASQLFATHQARHVLAVEMPKARSAMHLDTLITMVDAATFVAYPYFDHERARLWVLEPAADGGLDVEPRNGLVAAVAELLERDDVRVLQATEDRRAAEREQWNDADNYLAVAPGVVVGYDRNVVTNALLEDNGVQVLPLAGAELGRGRGGARCMSCPVLREKV